ncbi:MAG: Elongation factor P [Candidatus Yanofskybacteria bacterium GW2011_GWF1_44_227]|uniref:Elongation factor P n=1 Tax=Candidatus Yanofskybacteria bacterium GW2011_GWE2_40_11 TaxID=1619033 RepID=A0A0G0TTM8_9BACT|nr:MAG: Elongation factor P [Candidatus Yanofskybacteria bacterium GW2011_GWE1_40_10]KKR41242.1 MAG: Elongation factor P [Candidatus Yanofskybacteria bacterium GW2011_GWE2_40_11]KKT15682.1 MAG: Elongation factor P [Candidatus Yanofskybacteria bacterium GW2011_GWF2_43_596]KKT53430.1 MAG: Elongation factor P [Candidatus Yanofskybacteria bacterium GW2011_GWF1_44_227]HAU08054.1 elongation factor P [Candidatus Yanofskybacteria bacterium]
MSSIRDEGSQEAFDPDPMEHLAHNNIMSIVVNQLKPKTFFIYEDQPYVVVETHHLKMQQRRPTVQTKMRNLLNGKILERNFAQSDVFEEADIERQKVKFLYAHRDEFWFTEEKNAGNRLQLKEEILGDQTKFLKAGTVLDAILFNGKVINVELPVKMDFKIVEAPPSIKGNTAQGGVKQAKIETGAMINVPLFIEQDDVITINTENGEYVGRADKN